MIRTLNRFGEIDFNKNEALFTIPLLRLGTEEIQILEENYRTKIKEMDYQDTFVYANHISSIRDRLQMSFDLTGSVDFNHLHKLTFPELLPYLKTILEIARTDTNVLWEKNNFIVDLNEKRVKSILFEFKDFTIYKIDTPLDGLKEIILLALTKVERILGKPKRSDFIIKTDQVIQFAEDILRAGSLDDIERILSSYQREIEYEELRRQEELEEKRKNNKFKILAAKLKKPKKEVSAEEKIKKELNQEKETKTPEKVEKKSFTEKMTSPKGMLITIAVVFVGIAFYIVGDFDEEKSVEASEEEELAQEIRQQNEIMDAYRSYISGSEEEIEYAYTKLDEIGYDNLQEEDKNILINWYMEQGQYTKAISVDENAAYTIGNHFFEEENGLASLQEIASSVEENQVLSFDIALMQNQYQTMIDNNNIKFDERRAKKIVESYIMTNQMEELENFMDSIKDDEVSYENVYKYYDRLTENFSEKRELINEQEQLEESIEELENKIEKEKNKDDKKDLNKEKDSLEDDLNSVKGDIESINETIRES